MFTQNYTKTQTWNDKFWEIHGILGNSNLFLVTLCGASVFKMALQFRKKSEENVFLFHTFSECCKVLL